MADALVFLLNAQGLQQLLSPGRFKFLLCPVNPAAAQAQGVGSHHQVLHDHAAVVNPVGPVLFCQNDQHGGRAVEGVKACFPAADFAVHPHDFVPERLIGHLDDDGVLLALPAGGVEPRLNNLVQELLGHLVRLVFADAPPVLELFQYVFQRRTLLFPWEI